MRHYEIVFLVHPNQSGQVPEMIQRYKSLIKSSDGKVHRLENWGLRQLAYPINKSGEAHYVLMNIECTPEVRKEITDSFHFSDSVLRNLILSREKPIIEPSPVMQAMEKIKEDEKARKLKKSREADSPSDADETKAPSLQSDETPAEQPAEEVQASEEEATKTTENTTESDGSDNQTSAKITNTLGENDAEDTAAQAEHIDSTKK